MARYRQEVEGDDGWSRWVQPVPEDYRLACCDCGLVHVVDFRAIDPETDELVPRERAAIQFRVRRDARKTAAVRRESRKRNS